MVHFKNWKINRLIKKIKSMQISRVNSQPNDQQLKKEAGYYLELADLYKKLSGKKKYPHADMMQIECYRAAAAIDNDIAHYQLGQMLLEEARFRQNLNEEGFFNSEENLKTANQLYEQVHSHLLAAEQMEHIAAKRLRGLCLINGWGCPADKDAGFELIVASIEQEGSWDKVPQIFAAIGLNKPEFFAALMQRRKKT